MKTLTMREIQDAKREEWKQAIISAVALVVMTTVALWLFASAP
jgi:hypothetical protein